MKNLDHIRDRYLREPVSMRFGHLASDLARISSFLQSRDNMNAVNDIMEESKFFIEWSAQDAAEGFRPTLVDMQTTLALGQRRLQHHVLTQREIEELREKTDNWSAQLLELSGIRCGMIETTR